MRTAALGLTAMLATSVAWLAQARPNEQADREGIYLVHFAGEPLVQFRGDPSVRDAQGKALAPTAPAEGSRTRLDVNGAESRAYLNYLGAQRAIFGRGLKSALQRAPEIRFDYRILANAVAVHLTPDEADAVRAMPGVVAVEPDGALWQHTDAGPTWIGAPAMWNGTIPGSAARTRGEGVVVGILDGGINASHPSFADIGSDGYNHVNPRGGFLGVCASGSAGLCNDKVIGIWDFTTVGTREGVDTDGHGVHVAATAAGNVYDTQYTEGGQSFALRVSGVAPHANIIAYKVCVPPDSVPAGTGNCPTSATMAGLEQAVRDNVDVVNASLGQTALDPWEGVRAPFTDLSEVWLNARAAGIVGVLSAGNAGPSAGTIGSHANAPWNIGVASQTHNRVLGTILSNLNGTGIATPASYVGGGGSQGLSERRVVHAKDYGNALCGVGASQGVNPTGASNPFPPGTFQGEIVICARGIYARVEKSFNVAQSGAGGMILANTAADGESVISDAHVIPTVHLGFASAQEVQARVEAARQAGGAVRAAISATALIVDDAFGDKVSSFSSRGPVTTFGDWLKPNISAPGSNILAANVGPGVIARSGTSMASPHIAGAAALLIAANPSWSVSQVESALLTTGVMSVRKENGVSPADPHDVGTGRASVPNAARAMLHFRMSRQDFVQADPSVNGQPRNMNMPYLVDDRCVETCQFTRSVTDNGSGGNWQTVVRLPSGASGTVTPSNFGLAPNASQSLSFSFSIDNPSLFGRWVYGEVALVPQNGGVEQRVPVALFASPGDLPPRIELRANATSGYADVEISGLLALPDATFTTTALKRVDVVADPVVEDPTPTNIYDNPLSGGVVRLLNFAGAPGGARAFTLIAETSSVSSRDVDLYVGLDSNGNGIPEANEQVCVSGGATAGERCTVDFTLNGSADTRSYWIFAQNFDGTVPGGDVVTLSYVGLDVTAGAQDGALEDSLTVTGPGSIARAATFPLRMAWNLPRMLPGDRYMGFVALGATRNAAGQIGRVLVNISSDSVFAYAPRVLRAGNGLTYNFRLNPGTAQERVVLDVPPNATSLTVSTQANAGDPNVDLYVAKSPNGVVAPDLPAAPPRGQAQGTSIHPGAIESITLTGAQLTPGRWYITPVNAGGSIADFRITASMTLAGDAPTTRDAGYFNPARSGHGIFLSEAGSAWLSYWYTYLQDGTPTWYVAQADKPTGTQSVWRSPLYRVVWNGTQNQGTVVGEVIITRTGPDQLVYSWLLDGQWGSEPMVRLEGSGCATLNGGPVDFSGAWYPPSQSGYGTSVLSFANTEVQVAYIFDSTGAPRWVYGSVAPFGASNFAMAQIRGFCPLCAYAPIQGVAAGTLTRTYDTADTGAVTMSIPFVAPVPGSWNSNRAWQRLSRTLSCTP